MPLGQTHCPDNIRWICTRCGECAAWRLAAIAIRLIVVGGLLHGPAPPHTMSLPTARPPTCQISFDGGARHCSPSSQLPTDGPRAAGTGTVAALWGPPDERGARACVAQLTLSTPTTSCSMMAEALGLRAGLAIVAYALGNPGRIGVVGDNLPVLRMAAGNGRIRLPEIWQILEEPLMHAATFGWECRWVAVRWTYNSAADQLATIGT